MNGVLVAMGAKLFDFQASRCITAVFAGGVAINAIRSLVGIGAALGTFDGDDQANAFLACHGCFVLCSTGLKYTQTFIITRQVPL